MHIRVSSHKTKTFHIICYAALIEKNECFLRPQDAGSASQLDLALGVAREELGLHDDRLLGDVAGTEQFEVTEFDQIHNRHLGGVLLALDALVLADQSPQLGQVERGAVLVVAVQVEVSHTDLAEVSGMVLVVVYPVVVHATGVTATSGMLAVLAW